MSNSDNSMNERFLDFRELNNNKLKFKQMLEQKIKEL